MTSLVLPPLLEQLLAGGRWPATAARALRQNLESLVPAARIREFAPDEDRIYLDPPPYTTVREQSARNPFWTDPMAAPAGIDFDRTIVIGDFGLGSDAPIVLDYRKGPTDPRVLRLRWCPGDTLKNEWVEVAPDFPAFVALLGL
jgi:hypothetical protein